MLIVHRAFRQFAETRPTLKSALETRPGRPAHSGNAVLRDDLDGVRPAVADGGPDVVRKMFVVQAGAGLPVDQNRLWWTVYLVVAAHVVVLLGLWKWLWRRVPGPVLGAACALLFVTAQVLSPDTTKAFVYFQF